MRTKYLATLGVIAPIALAGIVYAATVPSDYARDVEQGNVEVKSDPNAASQANEIKDAENVEGNIDDGQVQVEEIVGDQEGSMGDNQSGEQSGSQSGQDSGGDTSSGVNLDSSNSSTNSTGGTSQ